MSKAKHLIIIPFAFIEDYMGGANIKRTDTKLDLYLKSCCVSSVSARQNVGKDTDVALVTNIDIPDPYKSILGKNDVEIIKCQFDQFTFGKDNDWSLAFYKLNAMYHICHERPYDAYCYMDSDVYVQGSFENIWTECERRLLLYDYCHGLQSQNYHILLNEIEAMTHSSAIGTTHYGGEFVAGSRTSIIHFMDDCKSVYDEMIAKKCTTTRGDEFIVSVAASRTTAEIRNAGPYVYRYWTRRMRLLSTNYMYNGVTVLHVPQEKEHGMLRLYNKYIKKGKKPSRKKVWQSLHLSWPSFPVFCILVWDYIWK